MSQGYRLVKRSSNPSQKEAGKKFYAVAKSNGVTGLNSLCELISARSSISSADVKAVIDSMNFILDYELRAGRLVQMGEFGSFRMSVGSEGADEKEDFTSSMIRKQKILFTPGKTLRETKNKVTFQRIKSEGMDGLEGSDNPADDANDPTGDGASGGMGDI